MALRTEVIKRFLELNTHADLWLLYDGNMEVQCNVAADGGERVEADYKGRGWHGWTDGVTTWKSFRIPWNAATKPEYTDSELNWDFDAHVEGIGMTGWDWRTLLSRWVAFDFDAIVGHKHEKKLNPEQIEEAKQAAWKLPYTTIRKSTSGKGLHIYVPLACDEEIETHTEHAALARSIIGLMSAQTGYDFSSKVDQCGGNMWVWHRKMIGTDGLILLKEATDDLRPPQDWRDHIPVIQGRRKKVLPSFIKDAEIKETELGFEDLVSGITRVPLDEEHRKLITFLGDRASWSQDQHMLITHTYALGIAHKELGLRGIYETISTGKDSPDCNCFAFPLSSGSWAIRRYTPGVAEARTWEQDGQGWTKCYFNREPTLSTVARSNEGVEDEKGGYVFKEASLAQQATLALGGEFKIPPAMYGRRTRIKPHKDGRRLVVEVESRDDDNPMQGWLKERKNWVQIIGTKIPPLTAPEIRNYDNIVRHLTMNGVDYGWMLKSPEGLWIKEPLSHVGPALESLGLSPKDSKITIGTGILKHWTVINEPFKEEYPGDRTWNFNAPQLVAIPSLEDHLEYPTWLKILRHCGSGLDLDIKDHPWARANGIKSGADYLKCWLASLIKEPFEPLPYLFFYGNSNIGKSTFHEAIELLITRGFMRADSALTNPSGFNAELINTVICVIEEMNLNKDQNAYNRIKDWVTSRTVLLHEKKKTPFMVRNATHWIQVANSGDSCPLFPGDTRITMIRVPDLELGEMIPKKQLIPMLVKEIPDFLASLVRLELPPSGDRLNIPVITTEQKRLIESSNKSPLELFIGERVFLIDGALTKFSDFYDAFKEWLDPQDQYDWSKIKVAQWLKKSSFAYGRWKQNNQVYVGNCGLSRDQEPRGEKWISKDEFLIEVENEAPA